MSILKYFKEKPKPLTHTSQTGYLTLKERKKVDEFVKQAVPTQESRKCGKYNCYTPEQRASIGKYAAETGPTKAARHFTKILGSCVNEIRVFEGVECCERW